MVITFFVVATVTIYFSVVVETRILMVGPELIILMVGQDPIFLAEAVGMMLFAVARMMNLLMGTSLSSTLTILSIHLERLVMLAPQRIHTSISYTEVFTLA